MTYEIYTFGNGEILEGVFNAISMTINAHSGSLFIPLKRLGLMIGMFWALIYALYSDQARVLTHWIVPMTVLLNLFFIPTTSVWIHDPITKYHQKVDHVPYGLAAFAGYVSKIGYHVTEQIEKVFSLPDDLKYQKSGSVFASQLIQQAKTFHITNEDLAENMKGFVTQCVLYDAMLGRKYTLKDLRHSADIWNLVSTHASPVRSLMWRDVTTSKSEIITCKEAVTKVNALWPSELDQAGSIYGRKLFGRHALINPKAELFKHLPLSYATLGNMAKSAEEILKQNMMIYAVADSIESKSLELGNPSSFAAKRAYLQQRSTYETLGQMAGETLPTMKAVLEAIAYSFFIFVMPLACLPFGWRILMSWGQIILWLQMWAPLYAILNFMMTMAARSKTLAQLSISNEAGVTLATSVGVANLNADISAMSGYLAMSIPFLCIALVKGLGSFVHMASHLGNVSQSSASLGASEVTSGNFSYGNISEGNSQIANTTMLTQSMSSRYQASSFQMMEGRTDMTTMSDGSQVVNVGTSNLPLSLNVAETQSAQLSEMASKSYQNALQSSESSAQHLANSYRNIVDLSHALGKSEHMADSMQKGLHTEDVQAINKSAQMIEDFAKNNNVSTEKAASVLADASVGIGFLSLKGSASSSVRVGDQDLLQSAQRMVESQDFQASQRATEQASRNISQGVNHDETRRLSQGISDSYEKGTSLRSEALKSFRQSEDYAHQAQQTQAQSSSINANYNQEFMDWLSRQPADHTAGHIGRQGAAHIIANDPQSRMTYAKRFMDEKGLNPTPIINTSKSSLKSHYAQESSHNLCKVTPLKKSLLKERSPLQDSNFKQEIQDDIGRTKNDIKFKQEKIKSESQEIRKNVQNSQGKSVGKKAAIKAKDEIGEVIHDATEYLFGESQKK